MKYELRIDLPRKATQLLDSVGLVCRCGKAVAGIEGVVTCRACGRIYSISVMEIERTPEAVTSEAVFPLKEKASSDA